MVLGRIQGEDSCQSQGCQVRASEQNQRNVRLPQNIANGGWEMDFKVVLRCVLRIHEKQQELVNRLIKFFPLCACHEKGRIGGKEALLTYLLSKMDVT